MKIPTKYKIERCAGQDETRRGIYGSPYFDAKKKCLVATDGHALVAVPVEVEAGDKSGYLDPSLLKLGRARFKKLGAMPLLPGGLEADDGREFPDWRQCVPESRRGEAGTATVRFDVHLLRNIVDALGCDGRVELTIPLNPRQPNFADYGPIHVRAAVGDDEREVAVLMPLRGRNEEVPASDRR